MRWPFMLRATHERILREQVLEVEHIAQAAEMRTQAVLQTLLDHYDRVAQGRALAQYPDDDFYFPAPEAAEPKPAPAPQKPVVEIRHLSGDEVVQRAEAHRNKAGR